MYSKLIKRILSIVCEFGKALFFYGAGKKSKENEVNKAILKDVSKANKIGNEVDSMSDDAVTDELSKYYKK